MATTMEQRAKFRELRLAGTPREEAQTQAYGNVAPPAISGQTVQPTGGATIPIAPQVTPATPTPAPMPTGGTATPNGSTLNADGTITAPNADLTQPKPVVNQELGKVGMTDQEIINAGGRINNGIQEMPAKEVDKNAEIIAKNDAQMALNKQNAELKNQERQAIAKETAQAMMPKSSSEMYNLITAKAPIPDEVKTTSAYRVAQNRYQRASKYLTMTPTQVANEIKTAKLIEGSEAWNDLSSMNPKLVQDATDLRNVNGNKTNIWTYSNNQDGTPVKQNNLENQFASDYLDDYGTFLKSIYTPATQAEVTNAIYTQDVKDAQEKATGYEVELNAIEKDMDSIEKDVEKELSGSGATGSRARLEKIARKEALQSEYNSVLKSYTTYANKANNLITQNTSAYEKAYNQKQELVKAQASAAGLKYKNELALSQNQEEFEQEIAQKAQAMNDPATAISTMVDEYKKLGIPFTRSTQQIITDFKTSGQDLATYLSSLQGKIQSKPEYQSYKDKQTGTEWQSTSITRYNPATGANESTPIFYRKKTSGGFEAVDLAGNPIDVSNLGSGAGTPGTPGTLPTSFTGDTASYIASKEGFREGAYLDSGGVPTIGYGFTSVNGKPVKIGDKITKEQSDAEFAKQIERHSTWKTLIDENSLSPSQKTALASFEYNLGPGIWNKSAMNIIDMIKSGDLAGAGKEMQKYNTVKGTPIKGLTNRRNEEASLLMKTGSQSGEKAFNPLQTKEFEAYDGKTIPAQYKTPMEQDQFVKDYNDWRSSSVSNPIKTGEDILKIQLSDKATEQEKNAIQYGSRMLNAINDLGSLEDIYSKLPIKDQLYQEYVPNLLKSDNQKTLEARKKDFITAVLRKESGASIAPSEFANEEKKYFAQPGDSQSVISAKQNARNFAIKAILSAAGKDVNGKLVSSLYNPPAITSQTASGTETDIKNRIAERRKKSNQ